MHFYFLHIFINLINLLRFIQIFNCLIHEEPYLQGLGGLLGQVSSHSNYVEGVFPS